MKATVTKLPMTEAGKDALFTFFRFVPAEHRGGRHDYDDCDWDQEAEEWAEIDRRAAQLYPNGIDGGAA